MGIVVLTKSTGKIGAILLDSGAGNGALIATVDAAPTNGPTGTQAGFAPPGSLLVDVTNKKLYQNTNTKASPTWTSQSDAFDAAKLANVANANVVGGVTVVHRITATNLSADVDVVVSHKIRVLDVWAVATAAGGAGDTITVKNGATAITDAVDLNVGDKVVKRASTIDAAQHEIAAGGTLRVTGASAVNAEVYVLALRVA